MIAMPLRPVPRRGPEPRSRISHRVALILSLTSAAIVIGLSASPASAQCFASPFGTVTSGCATSLQPTGPRATAFGGTDTIAQGDAAAAYGATATAQGNYATAMGTDSFAFGANATATGHSASAAGTNATATGAFSIVNGESATATGSNSIADGDNATATGSSSFANGSTASAYGQNSLANGDQTTAIGQASTANGPGATALGASALAQSPGAVAVGNNAEASSTNSIAIGNGAQATFANSSAFGAGATTSAANQMSFGTASNTYRMSGIASAASLAAQSGPTSFVTTDAAGNLAAAKFSPQDITTLQSNVGVLQSQMRQAFEGTAIAIAMGAAPCPLTRSSRSRPTTEIFAVRAPSASAHKCV